MERVIYLYNIINSINLKYDIDISILGIAESKHWLTCTFVFDILAHKCLLSLLFTIKSI